MLRIVISLWRSQLKISRSECIYRAFVEWMRSMRDPQHMIKNCSRIQTLEGGNGRVGRWWGSGFWEWHGGCPICWGKPFHYFITSLRKIMIRVNRSAQILIILISHRADWSHSRLLDFMSGRWARPIVPFE